MYNGGGSGAHTLSVEMYISISSLEKCGSSSKKGKIRLIYDLAIITPEK